jgi:TatD DNase family protein
MIDSHCHIDQYPEPATVASACEAKEILTIAVTSLPSHYEIALSHLHNYHYVRAALGFHPLLAANHANEISVFESLSITCRLIGEVGLDGSKQGASSMDIQRKVFDRVISAVSCKKRFVTVHSRGAVKQVLECLSRHSMYPVVFHWFSGNASELSMVLDAGHYFSFNPAMTQSAKWQSAITQVPLDRILTETDGPYSRVSGSASMPHDVALVLDWLAIKFSKTQSEIEKAVRVNFYNLAD